MTIGISVARKAIEKMYIGRCDIVVSEKFVKPNHATDFEDVIIGKRLPCKLSYGTHSYSTPKLASESQTTTTISASVKLFINPEIIVPAGSKIKVTQNGKTTNYKYTGEVALFETHQEIRLELAKQKA